MIEFKEYLLLPINQLDNPLFKTNFEHLIKSEMKSRKWPISLAVIMI